MHRHLTTINERELFMFLLVYVWRIHRQMNSTLVQFTFTMTQINWMQGAKVSWSSQAAHCNSVSLQSLMDPSTPLHPPFHLIDPKWCTIQSIPWIYAALWEPPSSSSLKTFSRFSDPQLLAKLDGNEIQLFKICFRTERLLHFLFLLVEFVYFKLSFTFFESASRLD